MAPRTIFAPVALALLFTGSCEDADPGDPAMMEAEPEVVDDLAEIPPPEEGANIREYVVEEQIIDPGTEVQTCYFLEPETEDLWANALTSYQGDFGHHFVLFAAAVPEPPGTRDCSGVEDMINLIPIISSVNFGLEEFPPGMAVRVPKGTQMVMQQHIVNTTENPIRVKDGMHLRLLEKEEVNTTVGFYGTSDITFVLPPEEGKEQEVTFECEVPRDMNLLLMGPHMHEWGVRFRAEAGSPDAMSEIIDIDPWFAEYRDEPPVHEWGAEQPLALKQGDVLRTTCVFNNTSGKELGFPAEMCATYGYYFPAPEGSEAWTCAATE